MTINSQTTINTIDSEADFMTPGCLVKRLDAWLKNNPWMTASATSEIGIIVSVNHIPQLGKVISVMWSRCGIKKESIYDLLEV